jgi:hypothetical protein
MDDGEWEGGSEVEGGPMGLKSDGEWDGGVEGEGDGGGH